LTSPSPTLRNRSFIFFTVTQYLGAFNDNVFKQIILLFAMVVLGGEDRQGTAAILFALPFIVFSGYAGQLAEMFRKSTIMRLAKIAELVIMLLAMLGFALQSENFLLFVLFLMGAQSAFFSPAKYGVIPELVEKKIMVDANGIVQMTTFLAIILGQAISGPLVDVLGKERIYLVGGFCSLVSLLGIVSVYFIRETEANKPQMKLSLNPISRIWLSLKEMAADKPLFLALFGGTYFWFAGALVQLTVNNYGYVLLGLDATGISILLVCLAGGIMMGCLVAGPLRRKIGGKALILTGGIGVIVAQSSLCFYHLPIQAIWCLLFAAGFSTGLYYIPLGTFIQTRPVLGKKAEILAAFGWVNFVGIFSAGILWKGFMAIGLASNNVWLIMASGLVLVMLVLYPHLDEIQ